MTTGQALAHLRKAKGLTQADLADRAGLSPAAISSIESGRHLARADTRRRLCKALGVPYSRHEELFGPMASWPSRRPSQ